jgi:hypothetical protein
MHARCFDGKAVKLAEDEFQRLMAKVHDGISTFDFDGIPVPCIILEEKRFDEIMVKVAGKPLSVDTNLNILQDGMGQVFVELVLVFSEGGIEERFFLYANKSLDFFESLAESSMLALSSPRSNLGRDNVFMIQLPRREKIANALDIIKRGLAKNRPQ